MSEMNYMEELDNKIENINYKEKINKIEEDLNRFIKRLGIKLYENAIKQNKFPNDNLIKLINYIKTFKEGKIEHKPKTVYRFIVGYYNKKIKNKLKETIDQEAPGIMRNNLKSIYDKLLPSIQEEEPKQPEKQPAKQPKPEPEPKEEETKQPEPEIKGINPTLNNGGALNERITRPNPDAPPTTTVSTTPIDDFTEPKQKKTIKLLSSSGSEDEDEEPVPVPEEGQPEQDQQLIPVNNSQQIVQSPKEAFIIAERDIDEFKNNPQLDIITGVGDVIEFIANSNLTPEMTDELIDQMLTLKDSHGNLLFNNRFQIEDLIINRKKRRRLKYLLPKRIIRAEKPDEQKLIINPMLRRGRIASMTSAKERYYNYI